MQSKFTIKRNTIKKVVNKPSGKVDEVQNSGIARKSFSDEI